VICCLNASSVDALRRKLLVAIAERQRQVDSFSEVNKTVGKDVRKVWQAAIDAFVKDHEQPNPYMIKTAGELQFGMALEFWLTGTQIAVQSHEFD
jgi:hypothetical protein